MVMVNIRINDIPVTVPKNWTILQACRKNGEYIPNFCYHDKLNIAGNCRICLVQIKGMGKLIESCAVNIQNNMSIYTKTPFIRKARENVMELLLQNHPLDCAICDQGGECDLQEQSAHFGSDKGRVYKNRRGVPDKKVSFVLKTVMTRCIHCTRCVRFFEQYNDKSYFLTLGRGTNTEIASYKPYELGSLLTGNAIDLCPVGALTTKQYAFSNRSWEEKSYEVYSFDYFNAFLDDIKINYAESKVTNIFGMPNNSSNISGWVSDQVRFSFDNLQYQSISKKTKKKVLNNFEKIVNTLDISKFSYIISPNAYFFDIKSIFLLKHKLDFSNTFFNNMLYNFRKDLKFDFNQLKSTNQKEFYILDVNFKYQFPLLLASFTNLNLTSLNNVYLFGDNSTWDKKIVQKRYGLNYLGNNLLPIFKNRFLGGSLLNNLNTNRIIEQHFFINSNLDFFVTQLLSKKNQLISIKRKKYILSANSNVVGLSEIYGFNNYAYNPIPEYGAFFRKSKLYLNLSSGNPNSRKISISYDNRMKHNINSNFTGFIRQKNLNLLFVNPYSVYNQYFSINLPTKSLLFENYLNINLNLQIKNNMHSVTNLANIEFNSNDYLYSISNTEKVNYNLGQLNQQSLLADFRLSSVYDSYNFSKYDIQNYIIRWDNILDYDDTSDYQKYLYMTYKKSNFFI